MDVEAVFRRDRTLVLFGLTVVVGLSWLYLADMAVPPAAGASHHHEALGLQPWGPADLGLLFVMWAVMMMGMMLPSASPTIVMFATTHRRLRGRGDAPYVPTALFVAGYLIVWFVYSALATVAQWGLHEAALLSPDMVSTGPLLSGGLLVVAGVFQWTPLKYACLSHCRSPTAFLMSAWRDGRWGAVRMGVEHGTYCAGCCWALMLLMFVGGVMSLVWMAALTGLLLLEKVAPGGHRTAKIGGVVLAAAGVYVVTTSL